MNRFVGGAKFGWTATPPSARSPFVHILEDRSMAGPGWTWPFWITHSWPFLLVTKILPSGVQATSVGPGDVGDLHVLELRRDNRHGRARACLRRAHQGGDRCGQRELPGSLIQPAQASLPPGVPFRANPLCDI
jgi:hypothetical protein